MEHSGKLTVLSNLFYWGCGMLYVVRRTSEWCSDVPPCVGAFKKSVTRVDRRDVDDPKKIPANKGTDGDWFTRGTNHRIVDGNICRDMGEYDEWFVDVADILLFVKEHGSCILSLGEKDVPEIEIYDDYRE